MKKQSMTTSPAALPALIDQTIQAIAVSAIEPSPFQPRQEFPAEEMDDLLTSIREHGIRIPLLGRPKPKAAAGKIELVAGERRWRTASKLNLATVPMIVQPLSDAEVIRIQRLENAGRENLKALEAAQDYQRLEAQGQTIEAICSLHSVKRSHVFTRLRVAKLPAPVKELIRAGKITITVADLLAKIPTETDQLAAAQEIAKGKQAWDETERKYHSEPLSFRDAKALVFRKYQCQLDEAPFDPKREYVATVGPKGQYKPGTEAKQTLPVCAVCPSRSGNAKDQFPELKNPNVCTNRACYDQKRQLAAALLVTQAKEKNWTVLSPKESAAVFPYGDSHTSHQYVKPSDTWNYDAKNRKYADLIKGQDVPPIIANTRAGDALIVYKRSDVEKAMKANGHRVHSSYVRAKPKVSAKDKAEAAAAKATHDRRQQWLPTLETELSKATSQLKPADVIRFVLEHHPEFEFTAASTIRRLKLPQLAKCSPAQLLQVLIHDAVGETDRWLYSTGEFAAGIKAICKLAGINLAQADKKTASTPTNPKKGKKK